MSALWDKVQTYANYRGFELGEAISTTPTKIGTDASTDAGYLANSIIGTTLTSVSDSPPGGNGTSWEFKGSTTSGGNNRGDSTFNAAHWDGPTTNTLRANYAVGFWIKFNFSTGGDNGGRYTFMQTDNWPTSGFQLSLGTNGLLECRNEFNGTSSTTDIGFNAQNGPATANTWYYITYVRTGSNFKIYVNGILVASLNGMSTTTADPLGYIYFRGPTYSPSKYIRLHGLHFAPNLTVTNGLTAAAISEIYTVGSTQAAVNKTITETPATATGLIVEPVGSTTRSVYAYEIPGTATALIVNPSNFASSNVPADPTISTALMTDPTIVIVNYDNVEVVTSITASATFPNPAVSASQVVNILATPLTASSEVLDHTTIMGTGLLYAPQPITASALMVTSPFVGNGDEIILADNMTASALIVDPTLYITPNYYNIVRSNNPSLFVIDPPAGMTSSTFKNKGYDDWGLSGNIGSNVLVATSPGNFITIGNGKSITQASDGATTNIDFRFADSEANSQADYFQLTGGGANDFTYEFWIYPRTYNESGIENVISIGSTVIGLSATQIELAMNSDEIPNDGILLPYTHTVSASLTTGMWHHIVITGNYTSASALSTVIYHNGEVKGSKNYYHIKSAATDTGIIFNANAGDIYAYYNGIALYKSVLSYSNILAHYNFVATSSPNRTIDSLPIEATALLVDPNFIVVTNKTFPATPITASTLAVDPSVLAAVGDGYDAEILAASATFVNPSFYGNPDAIITATALTASADTPQNVYRVDTAYYSYVQTNIAPIRYVTFDAPGSDTDWGSDQDFAQAVPFVYDGTITSSINGLNNNSLLSTGTNYLTSGLIMKESQWDDDWGTTAGSYHSSFWIKRHPDDVGSNGLRIIQSAYSPLDGSYGILYQQNNLLKLEMFNGTSYFTATSSYNVNVFDYAKHHIVVNFRKTGSNHFIDIYVDKGLALNIGVGTQALIFKNSATYLPPNTETNNMARMSVGALIPPIAYTSLPVTPTATKMYIDDVYWAATAITQTGVNNLYAAMPYRLNTNWLSDTFLSNQSSLVNPSFGTGTGINATAITASAQMVNPTLIVNYQRIVSATTITASALAVNPFSVVADSVTNKTVVSDIFIASAMMGDAVQRTTVQAQPMTATARIPASMPAWYDPYRALILQQSLTYPAGRYFGFKVGDID